VLASLLSRVCRLGRFGSVLPVLLRRGDGSARSLQLRRARQELLCLLAKGSVEAALEAALRRAAARRGAEEAALIALFTPLVQRSSTARFVLAERLLLMRVLPRAALPALLALLCAAEGPAASPGASAPGASTPEAAEAPAGGGIADEPAGGATLARALDGVAAAWGSAAHVTHAPLAQQRYLTAALLLGLDALPAAAAEALVAPLLSGVEQHLRSGLDAVRPEPVPQP